MESITAGLQSGNKQAYWKGRRRLMGVQSSLVSIGIHDVSQTS